MDDRRCFRQDLQLRNMDGHVLECSHYFPTHDRGDASSPSRKWPVVVFCHGNSSSRIEAKDVVTVCLPRDLSVFSFDFSGCGMSQGEYVTLGHAERMDLKVVLRYLHRLSTTTSIALWGRSMGASTSIFCIADDVDRTIAAAVLDSPFTRLRSVAIEIGNPSLPQFVLNAGIDVMRDEVQTRTGFDLDDLAPIEHAPKARCPAIFGASVNDNFVLSHHAKELQAAWGGESDLYYFTGGHNSTRPPWFMTEAANWLAAKLHPPDANVRLKEPKGDPFDWRASFKV